jgi:hypothetical protein
VKIGAPVRNRTSISAFGGLRHIRWTTGARCTARVIIWDAKPKSKQITAGKFTILVDLMGCIEREN